LRRRHDIEGDTSPELKLWLDRFDQNPGEAALDYWFEMQKGIHESLREF
jgi:glyceraldehyde-3-phosphate dehydrogenase (ferredoxin)